MQDELKLAQEAYNIVVNFLVNYSFQLIGAIIIIIAGYLVAGWASRMLMKVQEKRNIDITLRQFIASTVRIIIIGLFTVIALGKLGVSINPFIAAIGGLAVGVSFALQGPVSNYGAGLMIILTRLYKIGDSITIQNSFGIVKEISLSTTRLETEDGEIIIIPNKQVTGEIHRNSHKNRIMEGSVGIAYSDSPEKAIRTIEAVLRSIEGISHTRPPQVGIIAFADSAIEIEYRVWLPAESYYNKLYQINLNVFKALNEAKINIPFPQRVVQMVS
ncbi:MAG: mechanosensitive ion channel protein MscS [Gammaproteobacteria bacterium]|nr:MAG: mechanosensitive ion channel protein MscS [Gammaproteobacteria bacterium]